jgi:DNA-binding CsgD family transcriptional regulator
VPPRPNRTFGRQLGRLAATSSSPVMLGFLARVRALAAGDSLDADDLYREAIDQHGRAPGPAHLARSNLLYGEWLRRARRPRDARVTLLHAYQLLSDIGADGFTERARAELAAAGETRPAQAAARHGGDLTPQEAHVARLAAAGATNAEIAAQLYLSSNTVDYHLRKVFRKLGVTSRRQLTRAQPDLGH